MHQTLRRIDEFETNHQAELSGLASADLWTGDPRTRTAPA